MYQNKNSASVKANGLFDGTDKNFKININQKDFLEKKEGDIIFSAGDASDAVYLILDGEVKMKIPGVFGSPVIIKYGRNEFFGEKEFIENINRTTSAVANTDCLFYKLDKEAVSILTYQNKTIKKNFYKLALPDDEEQPDEIKLNYPEKLNPGFFKEGREQNESNEASLNQESLSEDYSNFKIEDAEKDLKKVEEYLDETEQDLHWDFFASPPAEPDTKINQEVIVNSEITDAKVPAEDEKQNEVIPLPQVIAKQEPQTIDEDTPAKVNYDFLDEVSQFLKGSISYSVSTIRFYADQIRLRDSSKEVAEIINLLIEQLDNISAVPELMKELSGAESSVNPEKLSINATLDEMLLVLADYIESKKSKLYRKFETAALISIDKKKFFHALFQIIRNMCESMPEGDNVYFISRSDEKNIIIEIKNSSTALPDAASEKSFINSDLQKGGGDIGLMMAGKIISAHSGTLKMYDENSIKIFTISLPASE